MQGGVPARGAVRVRAVLRAAGGRLRPQRAGSRDVGELRRRIQGGTAEHLALRRLPAARRRSARALGPAGLARGAAGRLHAADPRRPARRAARPARGVGQERRRQPDPLVQGPRRRRSPSARARELGFETIACASTGNLANSVAAHGGGAGAGVLRLHPGRPRGAEGPRDRRLRHQPGRGARATTTTSTASAPSCAPSATGRS